MKKAELEARVWHFIQRHNLISPGEAVVVGVSGGADSVCLLHILAKYQERLRMKLHAAHLNHQLRGVESEGDAQYVLTLARCLGIPITIDKLDVAGYRAKRKCSIEEAARQLRYAFLARVAGEVGARRIAIGHTRDDQVETILMHILRGSGIAGLCGLAPCSPIPRGKDDGDTSSAIGGEGLPVIRPLLDVSREETMLYCQEHQLNPRVDSSNLSLSFFRNRLRLELLPLLRQYNPGVDQALLRLADIAREDSAFIEQQARALWHEVARQENNAICLERKRIASLPIALQRQLLRLTLTALVGDTRDIEAVHIEAARGLLSRPAGKRVFLPHGLTCQAGYDDLVVGVTLGERGLQGLLCPFPPLASEFPIKVPGETALPGWKVVATVLDKPAARGHGWTLAFGHSGPRASRGEESHRAGYRPSEEESRREARGAFGEELSAHFDLRKTGTGLFVRKRRPGDRFQPLGMAMPKKLYEFMVDAKIPRSWRDNIPIVCSPQQIIWVVGWRIDDRFKVTPTGGDKEILRLEFIRW